MTRLDPIACRQLLSDPDTQGLVLLTILLNAFGDRVAGDDAMDPAELWAETYDRFGVWIPEEGENRVNALITACSSTNFYNDPETFTAVCMSLASGDIGDLADGVMEELEAYEAAWGSVEVILARQDDEELEFAPSVQDLFDEAMTRDDESHVRNEVQENMLDMRERFKMLGVEDHHLEMLHL